MLSNLEALYKQADFIDLREGKLAYARYNELLEKIAARYGIRFSHVVATFVALSPNSDYQGNLRSLISVLNAVCDGKGPEAATVSTYGHCKERAYLYATGQANFLQHARGRKIRSFYHNILSPDFSRCVTVDGHIYAAWVNRPDMRMKDVKLNDTTYTQIEADMQELADDLALVPNQLQATIWFVRKRLLNIKFDVQLSLFTGADNHWRTLLDIDSIKPYEKAA